VGTLADNGLIVGAEFREGNAAAGNFEFIRYCDEQMPHCKRTVAVRADSAAYLAAIFNAREDKKQRLAIGADLDAAVKAVIAEIPEALPLHGGGQQSHRKRRGNAGMVCAAGRNQRQVGRIADLHTQRPKGAV